MSALPDARIAPDAVVLPGAVVVGAVAIGARSSVWYGGVLRAEEAPLTVGEDTNLQDGVIVHTDPGFPAAIGNRVTVGHGAVVHGATVEDDCLIGIRSVVLNGARIGTGSIVAAGAVVREGQQIPPDSLVVGVPAVVRRNVTAAERELIDSAWRAYIKLTAKHTT